MNKPQTLPLQLVTAPQNHRPQSGLTLLFPDELGDLTPPEWVIEGMFVRDAIAMLYGASGGGKTFCAIDLGLSVASGIAYHGRDVQNGTVIYVAGEGRIGIARRVRAWCKHHDVKMDSIPFGVTSRPVAFLDQIAVNELSELLHNLSENPALIIIDTLNRNFGDGDENSTRDMSAFVDALDRLRIETGACIMVVHHTGKDESGLARGSSVLRAALDTEIAIKPVDDGFKVTCTKQKEAEPFEVMQFKHIKVDLGEVEGERVESLVPMIDNAPKVTSGGRKLGKCQMAGLDILRASFQKASRDESHTGPVFVPKRTLIASLQDASRSPDGHSHGQSTAYDFPKFAVKEGYARDVDKHQIEIIEAAWLY